MKLYDPLIVKSGHVLRPTRMDVRPAGPERLGRELRARDHKRYLLRAPCGRYLHMGLEGLTGNRADAWIGFASELQAVQRRHPETADFTVIVVRPDKRPVDRVLATRGPR